jgi:hypothetical protein
MHSVGPYTTDNFAECVVRVCFNRPARLVLAVPSAAQQTAARRAVAAEHGLRGVPVRVVDAGVTNKCKQMVAGLRHVARGAPAGDDDDDDDDDEVRDAADDAVVVFADDHVYWPPNFLSAAIEPLATKPKTGPVGTTKRARSRTTDSWLQGSSTCSAACTWNATTSTS